MDTSSKNTSSGQQGGANALKGFCYQIFLTIDRAIQESKCMRVISGSMEEQTILLVLEPADGGDLAIEKNGYCEIIQIKTSSSKWSITSIVNKVFPDLFKGINRKRFSDIKFIFASPTGFGPQYNGNEFLEEIKQQGGDWASLDNIDKKFLCGETRYTSAKLYDHIASQLLGKDEKNDKIHKENVWKFLTNFEYRESDDLDTLQKRIGKFLDGMCVSRDNTEKTIATIVGDLFLESTEGNQTISPRTFLEKYLGKGIPVTKENWPQLCINSAKIIKRYLTDFGYVEEHDIDVESNHLILSENSQSNILIISGDSGDGKTWRLHSLANHIASEITSNGLQELILFVDEQNDFSKIEEQIIKEFHKVRNSDQHWNQLSVDGVFDRIQSVDRGYAATIFVDNVYDEKVVSSLVALFRDWPKIRLIATCPSTSVKRCFKEFDNIHYENGFTTDEIERYFTARGVPKERSILFVDQYMRNDIGSLPQYHSPLLAFLYCDMMESYKDRVSLYRLFQKYIEVKPDEIQNHIQKVRKLAFEFWENDTGIPVWNSSQLNDISISKTVCTELVKTGIFRLADTLGEAYRTWHSLLLAYLVVREAGTRRLTGNLIEDDFNERVNFVRQSGKGYHKLIVDAVKEFFDAIIKSDKRKTKECFQEVVNKYSDWGMFAWLHTRKAAAEKWIAQLDNALND